MTQLVPVGGSRSATVECCGDPSGTPIFLLHGTPGSHCGPRPRASILYQLGVRLICYDRPGYGESTRKPGRIVADAARDVADVADALGLDDFAVVGRSGGGPHALACAALLGDRVRSAAVLVGLAPADAKDLGWYDGMTASNVTEYRQADSGRAAMTRLAAHAERVRADPEILLRSLRPELAGPDRRVVDDVAIHELLTDTYAEALRDGSDGWIDDVVALRSPWGFELSAIECPVLLWHGAKDAFCPVNHTYWLADRIRTSVLDIQRDSAHFGAFEILPKVLGWIKNAWSEGLRIQCAQLPAPSS